MLRKDSSRLPPPPQTGAASRERRNTMVRKVIIALAAVTFTGAMAVSSTAEGRGSAHRHDPGPEKPRNPLDCWTDELLERQSPTK